MIDFESKDTHVLLNPRMPDDTQQYFKKQLLSYGLKSHLWFTTSGTTAKDGRGVKCVALSKNACLVSAKSVNDRFNVSSNDCWLHALPDFHVGGIGIWARAHLSGAKVFKLGKWSAQGFIDLAEKEKTTLSALVPAQLYDLVIKQIKAPKSLRAVIIGGGALSEALFEKACALNWSVCPSWGLTECASQVATAKPFSKELKPLDHVQVKTDENNHLLVKSPSLLTLYFKEGQFFDPKVDGLLNTQDRGSFQNNCIQVFGRVSDFIKIGGESVNLNHLQSTLDKICHEHKFDLCTLSAQNHLRLGKTIILSTQNPTQAEAVCNHFNSQVMPYEHIRDIISDANPSWKIKDFT